MNKTVLACLWLTNVYLAAGTFPQAEISNSVVQVKLALPDAQNGFYRGTRFDWSGAITSLEYQGHRYYGPWFDRMDPKTSDFVYEGSEIVAGPCSAMTGPAEEFQSNGSALGWDEARPGETFVKIGVGVLRKNEKPYSFAQLYEIVDGGQWTIKTECNQVEFVHSLTDPRTGYGYQYTKMISLAEGKPELTINHTLKNTGRRVIQTTVYNHNFLTLDRLAPGPDFSLRFPYEINLDTPLNSDLAAVRDGQFRYLKTMQNQDRIFTLLPGFGGDARDHDIRIENARAGAGLRIRGDRPLVKCAFWSIRTVMSVEPFVGFTIDPDRKIGWKTVYEYYTLPATAGANPPGLNWTTQQDHKNMMEQLGIKVLRPGKNAQSGNANSANYEESKANPFPDLPDPLILKDGQKATTPDMWWNHRRAEIAEDFEREIIGRVPRHVPPVTWSVTTQALDRVVAGIPVVARQLAGHVDNSSFPAIKLDIQMTLVFPANAKTVVPVLMMFGGFGGSGMPRPTGSTNRVPEFGGPYADPPSTDQLIKAGWGYAVINPGSIQADNGAGLTKGIIGLVNQGKPRKPDDWGALRAWAWGAARGLDYLETEPRVDAKKVGIEGVSRFGKAALVTMAFEPRFALVLVGSSGEGGAKLHRRNYGESVENLTGSGGYHWMAGNFLKCGAAQAAFGSKNAGDLPVDAHELIALCAPRFTFISYGVPERGDAHWLDQQGSFMATVAAGPVFRLLGARDLGITEDYRTAKMPPVNTGLMEGELAWRQHNGGHEDRSNMKHFIAWANKLLKHTPPDVEGK